MHRVLKPNGTACVMVYHRSFWNYYIVGGFIRGIVQGSFFRRPNLHNVVQAATDGALARYYRPKEWQRLCQDMFEIKEIVITGQKSDLLPLPAGRFKALLLRAIPNVFSRFLTENLKMGSFLIAMMERL